MTNDGNVTVSDISIEDELEGFAFDGGQQTTGITLKPEESVTVTGTYAVTEADILKGSVLNAATATGVDPEDEPTEEDDDTEDPTEEKNSRLTVEKETTSEPADGKAYKLGEEITYKITVTNDGNVTIKDITVTDELTGDEWPIASLAPKDGQSFTAKYTVTEADVLKGEVLNVATATGVDPEDKEPTVDPGVDPEPTEEKKGHVTIVKTTTSTPANGSAYLTGETISYRIVATNDGNLTVTDITVKDELTGDEWTIASLGPKESKEFTATYTVTANDAAAGSVLNVATAEGTSPDPDEPKVPVTPGTDEEPTTDPAYNLTVHYVYAATGARAARDHKEKVNAGEAYRVVSPTISGYTCSKPVVRGTMPKRNVEVTVYYTAPTQPEDDTITIGEYGTALGLGGLGLNAGETIE